MNPAGHHLTSVALHIANSILLFLLLQRLTKAQWPSAVVAALFALHPMHVESVAWVSERKDVLSTLFWLLSIWAYTRWVESSGGKKVEDKTFYVLSILLFAVGLLAKPMLVTLPFVLLLLDWWPLKRFGRNIHHEEHEVHEGKGTKKVLTPSCSSWWQDGVPLVVEKIPFFILSAASCLITFCAQHQAVVSLAKMSFGKRLSYVPMAFVRYVAKLFWPAHLSMGYPFVKWPVWTVAGAVVLLLLLTALAVWRIRGEPWLAVGWLWFLVTLMPVIGIVQVGIQSMANRYTYIPSIGLFIAVVWAGREWQIRRGARTPAILSGLAASLCLGLTAREATYWKNTETLFSHAIQSLPNNFYPYYALAEYEELHGHTNAAISYLESSVRLEPNFASSRNKLGQMLLQEDRIDDALAQLRRAVMIDSNFPAAIYNYGYALLARGQLGEALDQFQALVNLQPREYAAEFNMGSVLLHNGLARESIPYLDKAVEIDPSRAQAHYMLANALFRNGRIADAIHHYERAVQLDPNDFQSRNDLAWILACQPNPSFRNGAKAVSLAADADQLSHGQNPVIIGTLAAGYAEAGKFTEAVATANRARQVALAQTNSALAEIMEKRLRVYQAGQPWRDPPNQAEAPSK
jgi:tetratricopeptide (TPR) repeat protein